LGGSARLRTGKRSATRRAISYFVNLSPWLPTIIHDEHGAIQLPAGVYAIVNQQEFDGLRWRTVLD